ncbi:class I SAM-dependent methyltransferase [Lactobacillus sp. PV037]|uniref:class I SAM-dependent methyltransferase n=1 Tax=unclassified Lactobacillus TaxID=2620435 RepID=UPI00223ECBA3|nr:MULTISPECIES: class I SAM-dependent methyltransferase [unclassified Lactobacillus]QNQ82513.1 class I SAM-dependent methyltransferase [Lactobacillus sp. PV012]QNQ83371.1 class I SAM-dependent methyltransferase [Lactobacillus sp. PV037]
MQKQNLETLYPKFEKAIKILKDDLNVSFSSALTETFDNLENGKIKVEAGAPAKETVAQLTEAYRKLQYEDIPKKEKMQVFTLLALKSISEDGRNYTQMPTPPIIATIIALIWQKIVPRDFTHVIDPTIGTGNLLYSVIEQLIANNHSQNNYQLYGIDNDETLLDLADVGAHLDDLKIELYRQDALDSWMIPKADVILSDLPVGYYPLDNNAQKFELHANEGHSLAHKLLIEQIINNLRPDGFAFLVVPKLLFTDDGALTFMPWLAKKVNIQAIIDLPEKMFSKQGHEKSILVFQNHGEMAKQKEVLVAQLSSLKDPQSLVKFNMRLNDWYNKNN